MMPHCEHSSCTHCLKHYLGLKVENITCSFCGKIENINECELEYFPKNITLNKKLREKVVFQFSKKEEERDTEESANSHVDRNYCDLHKMELEIVCLTDRTRICPHCALFSSHREH